MTLVNPHVAAMAPYALADTGSRDDPAPISLAQNESLRPPSPKAVIAAAESLQRSELYPDPDWTELRSAIASLHDLDPAMVLCGSGSLDLIGCLARAFAGPGRAVLAPAHAYPFFRTAAQMANARFDTAPERWATADVDALLSSVASDTGLVFLANPGNPTGTRIAKSEVLRLRAGLRPDILLVVDEAYGEFADDPSERVFDLVKDGNTAILRTFSKAYGLAGLRVGWGVFPTDVSQQLRKVMNPNNVSIASQAAALAAARDQTYMQETCVMTKDLRDKALIDLQSLGFDVLQSYTNFLLIMMPDPSSATNAERYLRSQGFLLRGQSGAGLPHALRMTIGPPEATFAAVAALKTCKEEYKT